VVLTVSVGVPDPLANVAVLNEHVGAGVPPPATAHARFTADAKPPTAVTVIVEFTDEPAGTEAFDGAAEMVKSGVVGAFTVRLTEVLWLSTPEVPVTVMLEVATGVAVVVVIVRVDLPDELTDAGANAHVAPLGNPEQASVTVPLNPLVALTVMVEVPLCPGTETLIGVPPTEKSGVATKPGHDVTSACASIDPSPVTIS
jgi:hypothetical protein